MSDYTDQVRAFARLNPDLYVPDTSDPVVFQAVARTAEDNHALGGRVMYDLTLGENARDVRRSPTQRQVPDRERYAASRMAAVTWRARAAQRAAAGDDLQDWQHRFGVPPDRERAVARRDVGEPGRQREVER